MRITIAGASGFVGRELLNKLSVKHKIKALSRGSKDPESNIRWAAADLFSYQSTVEALEDTDIAIYLVHSMIPTSRLFQGNFQDTDLFLADNFSRACVKHGVKQIIYLGGLEPTGKTSSHLKSRIEVENVFKSTGIPTTVLRAGMVVGDGGSSFEILKNLVFNLPAMVLPHWTKSTTQAIYLSDLVKVFEWSMGNEKAYGKTINVVNGEKITYRQFIETASKYFSKPKILIPVPINYTSFSKLWVKIFGEADYELVSPLIDSLVCDLNYPEIPAEIEHLIEYRTFTQMLESVPKEKRVKQRKRKKPEKNTVRSVQRLTTDTEINAYEAVKIYAKWLPVHMKSLIKVNWGDSLLKFQFLWFDKPLLILQIQDNPEELDRAKFHIVGGLLTKTTNTGWLEFRRVLGSKYIIASINEFQPALPWYLYKFTQAFMHQRVMLSFGRYLK